MSLAPEFSACSNTPESRIAVNGNCGHPLVLGLGMGWCAANVALNPAVERVTVIERDSDVIALIAALDVFGQLPEVAREKIRVVQADALTWRPDVRVDCVHADIWATFLAAARWREVGEMHANIGAAGVYFWGQELELWRLACRAYGRAPALDEDVLAGLVADCGIPLIVDSRAGYAARIAEAARWWSPGEDKWWESG
jgi:hypothetical protein